MNKFKLVRNKVPQLFERHHGYAPEELDEHMKEMFINKLHFARAKLKEEVDEFLDETRSNREEYSKDDIYEEAADVVASLEAIIHILAPNSRVRYSLQEAMLEKERKYGCLLDNRIISISEEEKEHYYLNIKGKVDNEF